MKAAKLNSLIRGMLHKGHTCEIVAPPHTTTRLPPINLKPGDEYLFSHEFEKPIPATIIHLLRESFVVGGHIFQLPFKSYGWLTTHDERSVPFIGKLAALAKMIGREIQYLERGAWILDDWSGGGNYFHWVMDGLSRLEIVRDRFSGHSVLLPDLCENFEFVTRSLTHFGVPVHFYDPHKPVFVRELLTASHPAPSGNYNRKLVAALRKRFNVSDMISKRGDRLYVSRKRAPKRRITNESDILPILDKYGIKVTYMESYRFSEQLHLMSDAEILVGLHGAGLTNMLFMPENGTVLEIRLEKDAHNNCFFALASDCRHKYFYAEATLDRSDPQSSDCIMGPRRLNEVISESISQISR